MRTERCEGKNVEIHVRVTKRRWKDGRDTARMSCRTWTSIATRQICKAECRYDVSAKAIKPDLDLYEDGMQEACELTLGEAFGTRRRIDSTCASSTWVPRTCSRDVQCEADPRRAEELIRSMKLEGCTSVSTPGTKKTADGVTNDGPLSKARLPIRKPGMHADDDTDTEEHAALPRCCPTGGTTRTRAHVPHAKEHTRGTPHPSERTIRT